MPFIEDDSTLVIALTPSPQINTTGRTAFLFAVHAPRLDQRGTSTAEHKEASTGDP